MDKNSFRSFICGVIITTIFLIGVPVSADTGTTLSDRIVAAITGNNINSRLDTMNTKLTNLTTAVNNSGGSAGSGNIKAEAVSNTSYTGGPGFVIVYGAYSGTNNPSITVDGYGVALFRKSNSTSTLIVNFPCVMYFNNSCTIHNPTTNSSDGKASAIIYKYI